MDEGTLQQNQIDKENSKLLFSPKYVPFYIHLIKEWLSMSEILIYWFIEFFLFNNRDKKFYFSDKDLVDVLGIWESTISQWIKKLTDKWYIVKQQKMRAWWGTIRFIMLSNIDNQYSQTLDFKVSINNNKIKENKKKEILLSKDNNTIAEYWNTNINQIISLVKKYNNNIIDWTQKEQRQYSKLLLNKLEGIDSVKNKTHKSLDILEVILKIISVDEYYSPKISSIKKIYYNLWELMSVCKNRSIKINKNKIETF